MALQLFNTLTRSVDKFVPLDPQGRQVGMYCCGPTVHDFAHIGNFRTFVFTDVVRRYLEFRGFNVKHVMNITDVEDKIIKRVQQRHTTLPEFTGKYEAAFLADFDTLQCKRPHVLPRATEHMLEIVALIEKLIARGIAYQAVDGSVYFSIEKYRGCGCHYGQLVNLNFDAMRVGDRVANDEYEKESVADFALWKQRVPEDGEVFWPSPWGEGRPGWHIECSAMSTKHLGESFDLHLGGEDLIFPHHEDEIAQSEGALSYPSGHRFVKHWMHGSHLLVEGKKMSKSLGNYFTLRDLLEKGFAGREIRYLLLTAHYRAQFNFTFDGLTGARASLARLDECIGKLRELAGVASVPPEQGLLMQFTKAMDDDLNVSAAWGAVFDWVSDVNRKFAANQLTKAAAAAALEAWTRVDEVFGLGGPRQDEAPIEVLGLVEERQTARKARDFKRSDTVRDQLKALGWAVEDTPKGPRVRRI